jgi:phage terminase small subunit
MTPMQRDFCHHYAKEPEAYKAMKAAGYSENYAKTKAKVMLANPEIVAEIQRLRQRMNERAEKSATDVVNEYSKIAFTDRVDFLKEDPHRPGEYIYKAPHELTEEQRSIVEKVTTQTCDITLVNPDTGEVRSLVRQEYNYVLSDKANALQQMGRHFGIFDDKLKLVSSQQNPFKNASPEQLAELKKSFVGIMSGGTVVDGKFKEVANVLPNGKGRAGAGG